MAGEMNQQANQQAYAQQFQAAAMAAQSGDFPRAMTLANAMLSANQNDPNALQIIGLCHARQGRRREAFEAYKRADELAPNQPPILNSLGALLKQLGDLDGAREILERVTALAPSVTEAHYNLASIYSALDDQQRARQSYERAVQTNPNHSEALAKYAHYLETQHDLDEARQFADRALAVQPENAVAQLTLAELDARAGDHDAVVARLEPYLQSHTPPPENNALLRGQLGKSLEKLGRYGDAFATFAKANAIHHTHYAEMIAQENSPRSPANLSRLRQFFATADISDWSKSDGLVGEDPIFLVGFPRSGTTMLDQILTSHPEITVLEEKENLIDAWTDFILAPDALERLATATPHTLNHYREAYWRRVYAHAQSGGGLIVDKLPLDIALLGFIHRFFPSAKFIFALRDPRDAVLSCFQQTFAMNTAMFQFLALDRAADYYDQVMQLGQHAREHLPLQLHEVRYENVIDDLKGEIEPLLKFLGVDWDDALLRYHELAKSRHIRTPSAKQVIQKPYKTSIEKWRHYEKEMTPVLPQLRPWATQFGYGAD